MNLTTGTGAVGSTDLWTVQLPGTTGFVSTFASNATLLEIATGIKRNEWATNACGKWISPHTITTAGANFGNIPDIAGLAGNYTYRFRFYSTGNCPLTAAMSLIAGGDNSITSIKLNGSPAHAVSATFSPLSIINLNSLASEIVNGLNVIDITVNNANSYTGMMLCGNLTIDYGDDISLIFSGAASFCPGDALTFNGSASSSTGTIQSHFWEIAECDAAGNYNNPAAVWNSGFSGAPGSFNFSTATLGFTPQCGKYYRVKLAVINPCVPWNELSKIIFIKCKPTVLIHAPEVFCEGSSVLLTVGGNATSYTWGAPINQTANSVYVTAGAGTTTYTVTGTLNGCTASAMVPVTGTPANLDINISTGVNNTSGALMTSGFNDDTWHNRGIPGMLSTLAYGSTPFMRVVNNYISLLGLAWVTSPNAKWITTANGVNTLNNPVELPCSELDNSPTYNNDYWFETRFNLPISSYSNLRMEVEYAVDNDIFIYLNSQVLSGNNNNLEYYSSNHANSQFTTLHNIGTIATNQTHYTKGDNTVLVKVYNADGGNGTGCQSVMGLLLNAHVKGECLPQLHRKEATVIIDKDRIDEQISATTFLYPNPSQGSFSIENSDRIISGVTVRDALGCVVKTMTDLNTNSVKVELSNVTKGFYFAEITYGEQTKPVFKKMIVE